jgi:hypothetical protein
VKPNCRFNFSKSRKVGSTFPKVDLSDGHFQKLICLTDIFKSRIVGSSDNSTFNKVDTVQVPFTKNITKHRRQKVSSVAAFLVHDQLFASAPHVSHFSLSRRLIHVPIIGCNLIVSKELCVSRTRSSSNHPREYHAPVTLSYLTDWTIKID